MDVKSNITISALEKFKTFLGLDKKKEYEVAEEYKEKKSILKHLPYISKLKLKWWKSTKGGNC